MRWGTFAQDPIGGRARCYAGGVQLMARLVNAATLAEADPVAGPALIEGYSSTIWVPPGWTAMRDGVGNTILHRSAA